MAARTLVRRERRGCGGSWVLMGVVGDGGGLEGRQAVLKGEATSKGGGQGQRSQREEGLDNSFLSVIFGDAQFSGSQVGHFFISHL